MQIQASALRLSSERSAVEQRQRSESLKVWVGPERPDFEGRRQAAPSPSAPDSLVLSASALAHAAALDPPRIDSAPQPASSAEAIDHPELDAKTRLLLMLIERLLGREIKLLSPDDLQPHHGSDLAAKLSQRPDAPSASAQISARQGYGVEYDLHESSYESERTTFVAEGSITTADGRQIDVDLSVEMSREFASTLDVSLRAGDAVRKDPLVVNFGGATAQLSNVRFAFDLNGDGKTESVPSLGPSSGFLAIDRNANGKVDGGGELFGPKTGDGFAELAAEDQDHNGWIDERDPVFGVLRVWQQPGQPTSALLTLEQAGIGAIAVESADTPFDLKDGQNTSLGQIRQTSVYIRTDGTAGTVQKLDLFV